MNIPLVCFLSVVALATIAVVHNIYLVLRCERLRSGQQQWRMLALRYCQRIIEKQGELWQERRLSMNKGALLALYKKRRNDLITNIWGSPTIVRDLPDVYTLTLELRDRLAASEEKKTGLASVIQAMSTEREALLAAAGRWQDQARANAEVVMTLIDSGWFIKKVMVLDGSYRFTVCEISGQELAQGNTPEEAVTNSMTAGYEQI